MWRMVFVLGLVGLVAACGGPALDLDEPPVPLGDFKLGHNVAVASKAQQGPFSRAASEEELSEAMRSAIAERFGRYDGDRLYHLGISVEGYVLAVPGIPIFASPKSLMIINVTVWDDVAGGKMNEEVHQITVVESLGSGVLIGSGYTLSKEEQLRQLSQGAAKQVERYLVQQRDALGWFTNDDEGVLSEPNDAPDTPVAPILEGTEDDNLGTPV